MPEHVLFAPGGATEVTLAALLARLDETIDAVVSGEVSLSPSSLAALESITAVLSGPVELGASTLAALEQTTTTIANLPADYPDALAATRLASILAAVQALTATVDDGIAVTGNVVVASGTVNVANLPATQTVSDGGGSLTVDGTVAVSNLPTPQTDALTNTQLRATPVPVTGTVTVTDGTGPLTVDGTVTVANPTPQGLTDTQLRATPVPVTGAVTISDGTGPVTVDGTVTANVTFPTTQQVSGTVTVANPTAQGLTDTQLRATPVPVSGTVSATPVNARVTGVLRAANTNAASAQDNTAGATRTVVVLAVPDGHSSSAVEISAASPLSQVVFEQSETGADGTWAATNMRRNNTPDVNESFSQIENNPFGTNNVQLWKGTVGGIRFFRVRCNALAPADAAGITVTLESSSGVGGTYLLGNPPSVSDYFATGTLTAPGDTVECRVSGMGSFAALFSGQWTGQILTESTIDGTTWRPINVLSPSATGGTFLNAIAGTGAAGQILQVRGGAGGLRAVRLRANTDYVPTTPATGTVRAGAGSSGMYLMSPAPIAGLDSAQTSQVTVGTTAVRLDPGALATRSAVEVYYKAGGAANNGKVYVGFSNGVTASNGRELDPGVPWALDLRASVQLWAIASAAGQVVSVTELA